MNQIKLESGKKYEIQVKTRQKKEAIIQDVTGKLIVSIAEPPIDNKANLALVKLFKKQLNAKVKLVMGLKSKNKVVEVVSAGD